MDMDDNRVKKILKNKPDFHFTEKFNKLIILQYNVVLNCNAEKAKNPYVYDCSRCPYNCTILRF